ncbi:hypothetical protein EcWSU1_A055 (plasmid) [Enterobacter ludwigii]|uniref:Uncharacterized protein n=1 Tax=Enterobacter ludwigii TaxID=299767 RepID=G8LQD3_9ENTR|nr:hypothetical protein EcWSU1_A055 [Enterobacter ludwigii]
MKSEGLNANLERYGAKNGWLRAAASPSLILLSG